ncbi:M23 family metallopeptidase [Neobacillus dielmonensis]|uniref:M23 family metallopeptidase n=1 Tax=Neobacillus dielmonensis TaxID=1347369 RepID=UPI001F1EA45A|nr:M23 family metallopeptidase [Neobacillus dielmonensis]
MARSTPDEIRRRIARRKREKGTIAKVDERPLVKLGNDDSFDWNYSPPSINSNDDDGHPLFKKEVFFFKILASILLFLGTGVLFRNQTASLDSARNFIANTMETDFKFAVVSNWYEENFGKPLALLPFNDKEDIENKQEVVQKGAVPVTGKILENFEKNGQGIMIQTGKGSPVQVINDGFVTFAGVKEGLGKTVVIQHADQTETWYGNLADIKVKLYEYIENKTVVGTVSDSTGDDSSKGQYYFAVKKGDAFIDPIKVIRVE